ncbi:MAG: arginyltransferase, partial [Caulobacterales bacterium]|nr:arginyltransferase [Caulobacterales bacterium]
MTRPFATRQLQFYLTAPGPCPYLPRRRERKVFAHLHAGDGAAHNDALTHAGFRRSQSIIYRPACEGCDACLSARVPASAFRPSRGQKRAAMRNDDLEATLRAAEATDEQYELLSRYLKARHTGGGMVG